MQRRDFLKISAVGAAVVCSPALLKFELYAEDGRMYKAYNKVKLVDEEGNALKFSKMKKEEAYIFNYPYVSTPSMIISLNDTTSKDVTLKSAKGEEYIWKGGVGKGGTLVANSAICSHQLSHPTPDINFVSYSGTKKTMTCDKTGVILCASHLSAFDPKKGGKNIAGPADQALASILLEVDKKDEIYAVGVLGPDKFHAYFKEFKDELKEYYGGRREGKKLVTIEAETKHIGTYSEEVVDA